MAKEETKKAVENVETTPAVTEVKEEKKPRKPREKTRSIEEIKTLPVNKLTDKEKVKLIAALQDEIILLENKMTAFKETAGSALAKCNDINDKYDAMERFYRKQLKYIDMQVEAFRVSIDQVTKGGIQ